MPLVLPVKDAEAGSIPHYPWELPGCWELCLFEEGGELSSKPMFNRGLWATVCPARSFASGSTPGHFGKRAQDFTRKLKVCIFLPSRPCSPTGKGVSLTPPASLLVLEGTLPCSSAQSREFYLSGRQQVELVFFSEYVDVSRGAGGCT